MDEKKTPKQPRYRSVANLGNFNDDEVNNEPSMTDPSQDETIEQLVNRMMRGELLASIATHHTVAAETPLKEAFESLPATEADGFDLSDAPVILERGKEALKASKQPKEPPAAPKPPEKEEKKPEEK